MIERLSRTYVIYRFIGDNFCLQRKKGQIFMFTNFNFSNSPLCYTCPCSHIHEQVNIYVSQFMYI